MKEIRLAIAALAGLTVLGVLALAHTSQAPGQDASVHAIDTDWRKVGTTYAGPNCIVAYGPTSLTVCQNGARVLLNSQTGRSLHIYPNGQAYGNDPQNGPNWQPFRVYDLAAFIA